MWSVYPSKTVTFFQALDPVDPVAINTYSTVV